MGCCPGGCSLALLQITQCFPGSKVGGAFLGGAFLGGLGQPLIPMEFSMDGDGRVLFYAQSNVEVHVCDTSLFVLPIIKDK